MTHQTMPLPLIAVMLLLLLLSAAQVVQQVSAFVVPSGHFSVSVPMIIIITTASPSTTKLALKKNKNFADEILDALDTMAGVSPLTETDLKRNQEGTTTNNKDGTSKNSSSNNEMLQPQQQWLLQRQAQREQVAPPPDALQKPSVAIFFALLGIIPSLLLLYAVSFGGIKPFGL